MATTILACAARGSNPHPAYTLQMPAGVDFDAPGLPRFTELAVHISMPLEQAQRIVDLAAQVELERAEALTARELERWTDRLALAPERAAAWGELHEQTDDMEHAWLEARLTAAMH
jgi:hypothetical protein